MQTGTTFLILKTTILLLRKISGNGKINFCSALLYDRSFKRELTKGEEDLLFQTGQLGEDDPEVLQLTVWWVLSLDFGFRARDHVRAGDFSGEI